MQLTQLISKGKVLQQDLRFILENAPATGRALREAFGTVDPQQIEALGLTTDQFLDRLLSGLEGLPKAAAGARNTFENFADAMFRAAAKVGEAIIPVLTDIIEAAEPAITRLADAFKSLPPAVQTVTVVVGALAAALGPALFIIGQFATGVGGIISAAGRVIALRATLVAQSAALAAAQTAEAAASARLAAAQAAQAAVAGELAVVEAAAAEGVTAVTLANGTAVPVTVRITALQQAQAAAAAELAAAEGAAATAAANLTAAQSAAGASTAATVATIASLVTAIAAAVAAVATFGFALARYTKAGTSAETATARWARALLVVLNPLALLAFRVGEATAEEEEFRKVTDSTEAGVNKLSRAVDRLSQSFRGMKDAAQQAADADDEVIAGVRGFITNFARNEKEVRQGLDEFLNPGSGSLLNLNPELSRRLREAIARSQQRREAGRAFDELTGKREPKKGRSETGLRNAQEQVQRSLAAVAEAGAEKLLSVEKDKNDALLRQEEGFFRLQVSSLRDFLEKREQLVRGNLDLEIAARKAKIADAVAQELRLRARAAEKGFPAAERARAEAQANETLAGRIKLESEVASLQAKQKEATAATRQELAEAAREQNRDIRQLTIEYGELTGRIEDALNAATDERFRESLERLTRAQKFLSKEILDASRRRDADRVEELKRDRDRNQAQIEQINNTVTLERANNKLKAAEQFVTDAKQKQSELEEQLTADVEFRGKREETAIRQRLAGEEKVKDSLLISRDIIQEEITALEQLGLTAPKALLDFVRGVNLAVQTLGKLSFSDQFRLAEKEFSRTEDILSGKIADVERRVRTRNESEVQGRQEIRRLNQEYIEQLERQAALLREIAEASGDESLQAQARAAEQRAKDARAAADELKDFDTQLKNVGIDSFRDSLSQLFKDLRDDSQSALQDVLNFFNRILDRVNDFIAENLANEIAESLFPDPNKQGGKEGGVVGFFKRILGIGGQGGQTTAENTTATEANTEAINGLTTTFGGQAAVGSPVDGIKSDPLGFAGKAVSFIGSLFKGGEEGEGEAGGGGLLGGLGELLGVTTDTAGAADGKTVIEALNINSDELKKNTEAVKANTEAQGGGLGEQSAGLSGFFGSLFGEGGGEGFASGGRVPIRVSRKELYFPPADVRRIRLARLEAANARLQLGNVAGRIEGPGTTTSDSIRAFAPPGSFIMSADAADDALLGSVNSGRGRFALGGVVDNQPASAFARGGGVPGKFRFVLVDDQKGMQNWATSSEGEEVHFIHLERNKSRVKRLLDIG